LIRANFAELKEVLYRVGKREAGAILADLGVSSNQIGVPTKGLSFELDGPLDMRLDDRLKTSAADLVNGLSEGELADLLYFQSQESGSRRISKRICQARRHGRINSTVQLARLVASALGQDPDARRGRIHPATRTFMALRMAVNHELESLRQFLAQAPEVLQAGGRLAVISFHSGEDRIVKEDFRRRSAEGMYQLVTKKPVTATPEEIGRNPRSRSAKLRIVEKRANT
jgi:16S rRNA (cytosine1402-N4)-methyltransferase